MPKSFGLCLGCKLVALGMRAGLVPEPTCERCVDIWSCQDADAA